MGEHPQFPGGELSLLAVPYLNAHLPDEDLKGRGGRGVVGSEAGSGPEGDDGLAQDAVVGDAFRAAAFLRSSRLRQVGFDQGVQIGHFPLLRRISIGRPTSNRAGRPASVPA